MNLQAGIGENRVGFFHSINRKANSLISLTETRQGTEIDLLKPAFLASDQSLQELLG